MARTAAELAYLTALKNLNTTVVRTSLQKEQLEDAFFKAFHALVADVPVV